MEKLLLYSCMASWLAAKKKSASLRADEAQVKPTSMISTGSPSGARGGDSVCSRSKSLSAAGRGPNFSRVAHAAG